MKTVSALLGCLALAAALPAAQVLAQSGVLSGPPQVQPGQGPGSDDRQGSGQSPGWVAVAGGFDNGGRRVGIGYSGPQRSRVDAEDAAINACRRSEPNVACRNPVAVSSGCLYAVVGDRPGGGVSWGKGVTREAALDDCQRGGFRCPNNKLIGGCASGYN